jgi:hypothetical protein
MHMRQACHQLTLPLALLHLFIFVVVLILGQSVYFYPSWSQTYDSPVTSLNSKEYKCTLQCQVGMPFFSKDANCHMFSNSLYGHMFMVDKNAWP